MSITASCVGRSERGSATVETAVLVPVLVAFMLFALALGRYEMTRQMVAGAARAAAEATAIAPDAADAPALADASATPVLSDGRRSCASYSVFTDTAQFRPGGDATVTVSCHIDFSDLLVPGLPGSATVTITDAVPIDTYRTFG